ncbi:carbonic anhydrase 2 [Phlebotomus papatasi]|uniref:carbonic anhydrase 2 n=1 Tax=Phlebotomus papatasi TaxID=29031 RepID=UPI002483F709|nr:carbonic anhydrase 2 [Phlebotomus papatasi]
MKIYGSHQWLHLLSLFILVQVFEGDCHRFGYTQAEQRRWAKKHGYCAGKYQSPIAINSRKAIHLTMPALELVGYHNLLPGPILIHNNGHSVSLTIPKPSKAQVDMGVEHPYIFGGKLKNQYELEGLHFHWGDKNNRGAEHVLNDIRYPMEMHIIHRNRKYKDVAEALKYGDGLTVLGFFYQIHEYDSPDLATIVKNLSPVSDFDRTYSLNFTFSLSSLISTVSTERFYTYKGSLTTPPCSEAVTWILFPDPLPVSVAQMNKFRQLSNGIEGSVLVDNYRALQPLGNRRVFVRKVNERNTHLNTIDKNLHYNKWDWLY